MSNQSTDSADEGSNQFELDDEGFIEELEATGGDDLAWWLREFKAEFVSGKSPKDAANELYFEIEEPPTDLSTMLASAVMFGVLWEKNDQSGS